MTTQTSAFFAALDEYIRHFRKSPPHAFLNGYDLTLQQKVDAMNAAVASNVAIAG